MFWIWSISNLVLPQRNRADKWYSVNNLTNTQRDASYSSFFFYFFLISKFNTLTPQMPKTANDGNTVLPFVTSSQFMTKDVFHNKLTQKEEKFQKVSKWEKSCELGQSYLQKTYQIWLKIEGKSGLPSTCHLLKNFTFNIFWETFTTWIKSSKRPTRTKKNQE